MSKKKIALVTMAKEEDYYLQEWINYHLKLGFDDIYIFQNNWRFKEVIANEKVHFMEWDYASTIPQPGQKTYDWNRHAQCYSKFGKDYFEKYEWAAFFDVDCFLSIKKTNNVKIFISDFDNIKQSQVVINFAFYGDNNIKYFDPSYTSLLERFTKRWDSPHNESYYQFVPICKLHENFCCHSIHFIEGEEWIDVDFNTGIGKGSQNRHISFDKAQINHYYTKTLPEWLQKMEKTRAEGDWMKNSIEGFTLNNFNDIEDLHALNFFKDKL